jgi:hypothetical protein
MAARKGAATLDRVGHPGSDFPAIFAAILAMGYPWPCWTGRLNGWPRVHLDHGVFSMSGGSRDWTLQAPGYQAFTILRPGSAQVLPLAVAQRQLGGHHDAVAVWSHGIDVFHAADAEALPNPSRTTSISTRTSPKVALHQHTPTGDAATPPGPFPRESSRRRTPPPVPPGEIGADDEGEWNLRATQGLLRLRHDPAFNNRFPDGQHQVGEGSRPSPVPRFPELSPAEASVPLPRPPGGAARRAV